MSYDPGYGGQPPSHMPFGPDASPVPDVSQPVSGFPPVSGGAVPPPPVSAPVGQPISGLPMSPPYGSPAGIPGYPVPTVITRPTSVSLAVVLTFVGVALAFVGTLLGHLAMEEMADLDLQSDARETLRAASGISTFIAAGVNLVAAASASICAIAAMRGSNGARVTLCVLCGLFSAWKLMCGGYSLVVYSQEAMTQVVAQFGDTLRYVYAAAAADLMLMLLAITILILLLTGSANRYFNPSRAVPPRPY